MLHGPTSGPLKQVKHKLTRQGHCVLETAVCVREGLQHTRDVSLPAPPEGGGGLFHSGSVQGSDLDFTFQTADSSHALFITFCITRTFEVVRRV